MKIILEISTKDQSLLQQMLKEMMDESVQSGCQKFLAQHLPRPPTDPVYMDIKTCAKLLNRSEMCVRNRIRAGSIVAYRFRGTRGLMFRRDQVLECIEQLQFKYKSTK
jgi:hypothetical protein